MRIFVKILLSVNIAFIASVIVFSQVGKSEWRPVKPAGFFASWAKIGDGFSVKFVKTSGERRPLLLEITSSEIAKAKSVAIRFRLKLAKAQTASLVILAFGQSGEVWFKVSSPVLANVGEYELAIPLKGLQLAAFSEVKKAFDPMKVRRFQIGLALDGKCEGVWEIYSISLIDKPFRPIKPFALPFSPEIQLFLVHDTAAKPKTAIVSEDGKLIWRTEFSIPGGRHMYVLPILPVPDTDLTGYSGLRLIYRARLPMGIKALLITLVERDGSHYYTDWLATPTDEWKTLTIPFNEFRLGGWSQDENGKLDLDQIGSIIVGIHGTTSEQEGSGTIEVKSISFVL
ncbi:MAG: hypothetical protein NZ937_02280 [Armatimonadetes bacterium]|nr:hypothetical protein [Armatimonadota bacterium]